MKIKHCRGDLVSARARRSDTADTMQDHFAGSVEEKGTKVVASTEQSHAMVEDAHTMQDDAADSVDEEGRKVVASLGQSHATEEEADSIQEDIARSVQGEGTKVGASSEQSHASVEEAMSDTAQDDAADSVQEAGMEVVSGQAHVMVEEADTIQECIEEGPTVVESSEQGFGSIECVAEDDMGMSGRSEQFRQLPSVVVSVESECLCQEHPVNSKSLRESNSFGGLLINATSIPPPSLFLSRLLAHLCARSPPRRHGLCIVQRRSNHTHVFSTQPAY